MKRKYEMKPAFEKRIRDLLSDKDDFEKFSEVIHEPPQNFIRCNTLKISPEELISKLTGKGWKILQPFASFPEIILITSELFSGELGNSLEHILGYYYIQEISSMMSIIALDPKPEELILDLFASPGSKTTQLAAKIQNKGTIIANDLKIDRIKILVSNLERCGATNCIVSRKDAVAFCSNFSKSRLKKFNKILVDAPCSGEGTLRSNPRTFNIWNEKIIKKLSRQQKKFIASALKCLAKGGVLVYSTCTHAPEENEEIVDFALRNFPVRIETLNLPLKCRPGVAKWQGKTFIADVRKCCGIYPQDNNSEGFFVSKLTLLEEVK